MKTVVRFWGIIDEGGVDHRHRISRTLKKMCNQIKALTGGVVTHQRQYYQLNQKTVLLGLLLFQIHTVMSLTSKSQYQQDQSYRQRNTVFPDKVEFSGKGKLKYVWGDALADPKAMGPDGNPYPWDLASKIASKQRNPRTLFAEEFGGADIGLINPETTRQILLKSFEAQEFGGGVSSFFGSLSHSHHHHHAHSVNDAPSFDDSIRKARSSDRQGHAYTIRNRGNKRVAAVTAPASDNNEQEGLDKPPVSTSSPRPPSQSSTPMTGADGDAPSDGGCVPSRLCPSTYNTTAPLYGISLTSGQAVTIVQKFPDLLQQVVFQVCKTSECDVIHGECVQTYLPYLFLVIPLGPVTLTGQDYVLVESGCVCRPKYASKRDETPQIPFIQVYNTTKERRTHQG